MFLVGLLLLFLSGWGVFDVGCWARVCSVVFCVCVDS